MCFIVYHCLALKEGYFQKFPLKHCNNTFNTELFPSENKKKVYYVFLRVRANKNK